MEERKKQQEEQRRREAEYIRKYGGGYCNSGCIYYHEEYMDRCGGVVGDIDDSGYIEYNCDLGYFVSYGSFCKDYKE